MNKGDVMKEEQYRDSQLRLEWLSWGQYLKVWAPDKTLLFSSVTGDISPALSDRQVKWILEHYEAKRKCYVFTN
jgi:hypothetical protein